MLNKLAKSSVHQRVLREDSLNFDAKPEHTYLGITKDWVTVMLLLQHPVFIHVCSKNRRKICDFGLVKKKASLDVFSCKNCIEFSHYL